MKNLLRDNLSVGDLTACFADCPPIPLLPRLGDPAWHKVVSNPNTRPWVQSIQSRALAELNEPLPSHTNDSYAEFHRSGNRLRFETKWFERRRRVARGALAALTAEEPVGRDRFLASTLDKLKDTFAEESWAFPAHVGNPTGKDPFAIDLFGAETANLFGELLNLFPALVPADLTAAIHRRLRTQFFEQYLNHPPAWASASHNWNAVCHQGMLGAALAVADDAELLGKLFDRAAVALRLFLGGFSADGGSSEGPGYWGYGFGWMAELNHQLETRTRGQLSLFEKDPIAHAIATFGPKMTLSNGLCVNFSDNGPRSSPRPSLLTYLGERFDDNFIRTHAVIGWQRAVAEPIDLDHQRADLFHFTRNLLRCPGQLGKAGSLPETDIYLPELGVAVLRFRDQKGHLWEFAAKGGNNAEHHNHNDIGSYLLNIDGRRLLVEIGAPEYVKDFFSSKRYTFLAARSLGHPVPLIDGKEQSAGKEFYGTINSHTFTETVASIEIDLTGAYPADAGCKRCIRRFHLDKRAGVLSIVDTFELTRPALTETALITEAPATLVDGAAMIHEGPITLRISPSLGTRISEIQRHEFNNHSGKRTDANRIVLLPTSPGEKFTLSCTVRIVAP